LGCLGAVWHRFKLVGMMIVLFSDFGHKGPYVGQMTAAVYHVDPKARFVNLIDDAPSFKPELAAYLLAAFVDEFPHGTIFLCIVDPGVGSERKPIILEADGRYFVGPDNGLMAVVARRAAKAKVNEIVWRPQKLSETFHGRDLFAPVAGQIARGNDVATIPMHLDKLVGFDGPNELEKVVYIDAYGNIMTGLRASSIGEDQAIICQGMEITWALRFSSVQKGDYFWYENSNGLVEIAVREGNAAELLGLGVGDEITVTATGSRISDLGRTQYE